MKRLSILYIFILLALAVSAQSVEKNYVMEQTFTSASSDGLGSAIATTIYYDGLGRKIQSVVSATNAPSDIADHTFYDSRGRVSAQWIQSPGNGNGEYTDAATLVEKNHSIHGYSQRGCFDTKVFYEPNAQSRITEIIAPGYAWSNTAGVTHGYGSNSSSGEYALMMLAVHPSGLLHKIGMMTQGDVRTTTTTDEDGVKTILFFGRNDSILLERRVNGTEYADTYYVYDRQGNRRYVVPPLASAELNKRGNTLVGFSDEIIKNYCYTYNYESRNRLIEKKLPGAEPIYYLYNRQGLLRYSQDGNMRQRGELNALVYDMANRVVITAITPLSESIYDLRDSIRNTPRKYAEFAADSSNTGIFGYDKVDAVISQEDVMSVNYYDDYRFVGLFEEHGSQLDYRQMSGYDEQYVDSLLPGTMKGYRTGRLTRVLDTDVLLVEALYYDSRGRVIQSHSSNHLGGYDHRYYRLTFTGKPLEVRHEHSTATQSHVDIYRYSYDAMERLLAVSMQHDGGEETILQSNSYDAIGRLATQAIDNGATSINYTYNVRGWVTGISSSVFTQNVYYNEDADGNDGYFNGNIVATKISFNGRSESDLYTRQTKFKFSYDKLNRLSQASIHGYPTGASYFTATTADVMPAAANSPFPDFSTSYTYDLNGNIKRLTRYAAINNGGGYIIADSLIYTHSGNQIRKITDYAEHDATSQQMLFSDGADEDSEYTWDANGNMTSDLNKGITGIEYNALNLPRQVTFADGHITEYLYDAGGNKLQTKYLIDNRTVFAASMLGETDEDEALETTDSSLIETLLRRDYAGNYIYANDSLLRILTPTGFYTDSLQYRNFIHDYQGNVVNIVPNNGANFWMSYYPYGTPCLALNANNPYYYGGKELDRINGLDMYDQMARQYSPVLGGFTSIDPLCEKYYGYTPYIYCLGNPIRYNDPTGMEIVYNMTEAEKQQFLNSINMLQESNLFSSVYNKLDESTSVYEVSFGETTKDHFEQSASGELRVSANGGSIVFLKGSNPSNLIIAEEFYHAYQNEDDGMGDSNTNYEFEAKVFATSVCAYTGGAMYGNIGIIETNIREYKYGSIEKVIESITPEFKQSYINSGKTFTDIHNNNNTNNNYRIPITLIPTRFINLINSISK